MANENDGLYISASLDIPVTEQNIKTNDIPKINSDLASDQNAKIKLNAEVDYNKVKSNVQNQLNSIASKLKLNVNSVSIDTNKVVEPLRKGFKQLFTEISNTKLVDTNVMAKNVKEMFGVNNTKEIKQAYDDLKQTLALNPNDMKAIMQSYTNLSSTILDGVSLDKEFDTSYLGLNKIYNKVFECATAFNEVTTNTKTTEKQIVSTSEKSVNELNKLKVKTDELKNQFNTPLKSVNGITTQFDTSSLDVVKEAKKSFEDLFSGTSSKFSTNINSTIGDNGIKKVQNFTIQVKSATGEVEKFKYVLTNIGNQIQPDFKYVLQNINEADEGVLRLQDAQSKFDSKVQSTITSLKTQAEILQTSYTDSNSSKYVKNQANIDDLNKEYKNTISVIENLKTASNTTFESMKADATSSIEKLRNLINLTNRAENPATSLRKKDIETNKSVYGENIDRLVSQLNNLKSAEPILTILKTDIENVRNALNGVTDASGFEKFLNQFDILDAKAKRLKTLFSGYGSTTWFSDNKEQIDSMTDVSAKAKIYQAELKRLTDEWKSQGIYVDGIKQKAGELSRVIGNIKNPEIFEKRTSEFDTLVTATKQVKTNLDEQVATYQKIYDLKTKITKLSTNPEKNATSIANYSAQLAEQKQHLSNLQMQSNAYKNVISLEQQERIVLSAVTKEQEKLNITKAKATDTSRVNTEKETASIEKYRQKIDKLIITLELLKQANSKAMSGKFDYKLQADSLIAQLQSLQNQKDIPLKELKTGFDNCNASANKLKNTLQVTGNTGASAFDTLKEKVVKFSSWMGITTTVSYLANTVRNAVNELKDLDTILTEISKTSDRTDESLRNLGNNAFDEASALGQKATDYLSGVQEASRAGFDEKGSENMAKLSVLAQSAGDMTSELANQYLIATNAAYKFSGDTEKLNAVLDSQNYITNHNALNMTDLAEATKIAASQASAAGIESDKLTAAVGTMIATTQQGGDIAGRAFKGILMNLQQIKGTADDIGDGGADITTESLSKYEKACADLGVSLKEVKNGTLQLRDPMQILSELSSAVSKESENSVKVANLINAVGGKFCLVT